MVSGFTLYRFSGGLTTSDLVFSMELCAQSALMMGGGRACVTDASHSQYLHVRQKVCERLPCEFFCCWLQVTQMCVCVCDRVQVSK